MQLATEFGLDPTRWIVTKKPDANPEPPSLSINVKPEDLDPALPELRGHARDSHRWWHQGTCRRR